MSWAGFLRADAFTMRPRFDGQPFHVSPGDPGGATSWAVIFSTFVAWRMQQGLPAPTLADFRMADPEELRDIRHALFWLPAAGDRLRTGPDLIVWEIAIGSGGGRAAQLLKRALGLPEDHRMDAATVRTANCQDAGSLVRRLTATHRAYVDGLAGAHRFGAGWDFRITAAETTALEWIEGVAHA